MSQETAQRPLCVDLDGTLIETDMLYESVLLLAKKNPLNILKLPAWFSQGKAPMKRKIAESVDIDPVAIPYNSELLEYLKSEKSKGKSLVLATATDKLIAVPIAEHLGIFSEIIASDGKTNISGTKKQAALDDRFSKGGYDYVGDSSKDIPVWEHAKESMLVSDGSSKANKLEKKVSFSKKFQVKSGTLKTWIKALRLKQWVKNLLIFVPLLAGHQIENIDKVVQSCVAFLAFGLCASGVYVLNDLLDISADRLHPIKKNRPFAAGALPVLHGIFVFPAFFIASFALSLFLSPEFLGIIFIYFFLTSGYSFYFKKRAVVDIITLAVLYTIRIFAGSVATDIPASFWLINFSVFLFFSLATVKRYVALEHTVLEKQDYVKGRGYCEEDLKLLPVFGVGSGYLSVLVLGLYLNSEDVRISYTNPKILWVSCLVMLYWISRVWLLVGRKVMNEDPIIFALRDKRSYVAFALVILAGFIAT